MEGLPWVLQPLPGEGRPQPRVTVMKSRVENRSKEQLPTSSLGQLDPSESPVPLAPCWDVSGASGAWGYQIEDEHVCRQEAGSLRPPSPCGHFEGELGCIQE